MNHFYELWMTTGFPYLQWQMVVMWGVVALLLYLAIVKEFEPLLLVPISLGALISNLPIHDFIMQHPVGEEPGGLFYHLNQGIKLQIYPPRIMKLCTTDAERRIKMKTLRKVSRLKKLVFAAVVMSFCCIIVRDAAPLIFCRFPCYSWATCSVRAK